MGWPINFGALSGGNQPLSDFDVMFQQVAATIAIPCSATGVNAISLAPLNNCPALTSYLDLCGFRFRAAGTSSGAVTAQHNGLGFLPVFRADGVTHATTGDLLAGQEYVIRFSQPLNGGTGGFYLEAPAFSPSSATVTALLTPGGRLTFQSGVPVMSSNLSNQQTIFYAPYSSPFIQIYNGVNVQAYQFTSSLVDQVGISLAMGGSANWPIATMFDLFVTLVGGAPTLCSLAWTNTTTRATGLAIFGGFLTNAAPITARTTAGTLAVAVNQATYVGSFFTSNGNGASNWQFGAPGSGGVAAAFCLYNYYNQILVNSVISDTGAPYSYTSATVRQARNSNGNGFTYVQGTSEKAALFDYVTTCNQTAGSGAFNIGIGVNVTNAFSVAVGANSGNTTMGLTAHCGVASTGLTVVNALEQGGASTNFDQNQNNELWGHIWL